MAINKKNVACKSTNGVPEIVYDKVAKLILKIKALNLIIFNSKKNKKTIVEIMELNKEECSI